MKIEIDQSIKIEDTARNTVIADSIGNHVCISAKTKRTLQHHFRRAGKPRLFVLETFSFLVAYLISNHYEERNRYVIDIEYPGNENVIKSFLFRYTLRLNCPVQPECVSFELVGKKSLSHQTAYIVATSKQRGKNSIPLPKLLHFLT